MQKLISSKPSIYCVDALNLVRRSEGPGFADENSALSALLALLESAAGGRLRGSEFRLFIDGAGGNFPFRPKFGVFVRFSGAESADDLILDTARYLKAAGKRAVVVTSDGGLMSLVRQEGVKCLDCDCFVELCRRAAA